MSTTTVIPFKDVWTHSAAGTLKTMIAGRVPDSPLRRCRLVALTVVAQDAIPLDEAVEVNVNRIDDVSAGAAGTPTTTIAPGNLPRPDPHGPDMTITALRDYKAVAGGGAAEPGTYMTEPPFQDGLNARGSLHKAWDPDIDKDIVVAGPDQMISLRCASKSNTAVKLSGSITIEEH